MEIHYNFALLSIFITITSAQYNQQYRPTNNGPPQANYAPKPIPYPSYQSYSGSEYKRPVTPSPIILSHRQSLTHDGGFKYAFAADNGLQQGETIAPDGTRLGQYSYVDPSGQTITVKYSAGKEGFRILEGAHVPQPVEPQQKTQNQQPEIYSQPETRPQIFAPSKYIETHQNDKYTQAYHQHQYKPSPYVPSVPTQYSNQIPVPRYLQFKNVEHQAEERQVNDNAIQREPEYHDEPGKPHSFGNGYSFEFSG